MRKGHCTGRKKETRNQKEQARLEAFAKAQEARWAQMTPAQVQQLALRPIK